MMTPFCPKRFVLERIPLSQESCHPEEVSLLELPPVRRDWLTRGYWELIECKPGGRRCLFPDHVRLRLALQGLAQYGVYRLIARRQSRPRGTLRIRAPFLAWKTGGADARGASRTRLTQVE